MSLIKRDKKKNRSVATTNYTNTRLTAWGQETRNRREKKKVYDWARLRVPLHQLTWRGI